MCKLPMPTCKSGRESSNMMLDVAVRIASKANSGFFITTAIPKITTITANIQIGEKRLTQSPISHSPQ